VRRFGLAGSPDTCRRGLRRLLEAVPEISQVTIVPFAARTGSVRDTVQRFIEEVGALEPAT
jgi:5,10-methylenetetrahydromethanopterin reductase